MKPAKKITVTLSNEKKYQAKVIGLCKDPDVALIKIDPAPGEVFPYAILGDSDTAKMGQRSYAYGAPGGLKRTLTAGIISNVERTDLPTFTKVIQTDAPINPGNSGGPLFNEKGEVLGLNTYAGGGEGLGFTLPINVAKTLKDHFLKYGYFRRASFPFFISKPLTEDLSKVIGVEKGVFVDDVFPNSPAAQAGLKPGDILIEMNDQPICARNMAEARDFRWKLVTQEPGTPIKFKVIRGGQTHIIKGILLEDEPLPEGRYSMGGRLGGELPEFHYEALGLCVKRMTYFTYYLYDIPQLPGVRLTSFLPGTPAAKAGLANNDLITALDDILITNLEQFQKELETRLMKRQKYISLTLARGKDTIHTALKPIYVLAGKKVALLVPPEDSEYFDLIRRILIEHGAEVIITSTVQEITLGPDRKINIDIALRNLKSAHLDGLILIGGKGAERYWEEKTVHALVKDMLSQKKIIGAIGAASIILIHTEPTLKKKITSDEEYTKIALEKKANYTGKDVEHDENIITTSGTESKIIKSFLNKFKSVLKGKPHK